MLNGGITEQYIMKMETRNDFDYELNTFVAINPDGDKNMFWTAKILAVNWQPTNASDTWTLNVRW